MGDKAQLSLLPSATASRYKHCKFTCAFFQPILFQPIDNSRYLRYIPLTVLPYQALCLPHSAVRSDQHSVDANQKVPTGFQSLSIPAPGSGDGGRPPWGHPAPCSHSEKTPTAVLFSLPTSPMSVSTPNPHPHLPFAQQHASAPGQKSGITEVVVFLFIYFAHDLSPVIMAKCMSFGKVCVFDFSCLLF